MANTKVLKLKRNVKSTDGSIVSVVLCKFPIDTNAKSRFTIGKEDYIKVSFTTAQPIALEIGDYIDDDEIGIYKLHKRYKPEYSDGAYVYDLQLDSYYMMWDNQIMIYNPSVAAGNLAFTLTGMLELQCALLKSNLKYLGLQYRGLDFVCVIDTNNIKNEAQTIECNNTSILSFMNNLATKFECECWVIENKIYFGKCEFTDANATETGYIANVSFTIGKNCIDMKPDESKIEYANRVYVFGGTNNITQRYRKSLIYKVTEVSQYNSTKLLIKDALRPLFSKYFKQSERSQQIFTVDGTNSNSDGFETVIVSKIGTITSTGTFDFSSLPIQFTLFDSNGNAVTPSQTDTYELTTRLIGSKNGVENVIAYNSVKGSFADSLNLKSSSVIIDQSIDVSTYFDYKITISVYPTITSAAVKKYKCDINGSYTFSPSCPIINTTLVYNGSTYNVVVNQKQDSNTDMSILLPEGLTMAIGDTYMLPNIITGKVPQSQFTASEGETNNDLVYQGTVQKRLMLPVGTPYIQSPNIQNTDQLKTAVLVYDDIYPRFHGQKITSATSVMHTEKDDSGNITYQYPLFTISDNTLAFDGNSILDNTKPMIIFQTGNLAGVSFTLDYLGSTNGVAKFTIEYDKDKDLPNTTLKPRVGDEYVLYNIDPSYYSAEDNGTLEDKAEQELLAKATKDANIILGVNDTFNCTIKGDWLIYKESPVYRVGQEVTLVNASFFETGSRISRIIGWEKQLDCPNNNPTYIVGDSVSYDRLADMQEQIDSIKFNGNTYNYIGTVNTSETSASIYIVTVDDKTSLSNDNTMSSLRILEEISKSSVKHAVDADNAKNADVAKNLSPDSTDWGKMILKTDFEQLFEKVNIGTDTTPAYAIHAKLPLYTEGGLTAYGKGTSDAGGGSGIDETLLWQILGNTSNEQISENHISNALSPYALAAAIPTKLSQLTNDMNFVTASIVNGYATQTWCNGEFAVLNHKHAWADITDHPTELPASDVYGWAKAATKPAYSFSEIGGTPTTLNGYGISDAAAKTHTHTISQITDIANASVNHAINTDLFSGHPIYSFITDAGGNYSGTLYNLTCKSIFSGYNLTDAPVQGWISGIVLGDNWNSNHYQKYIVASGNNLYYGNNTNPPTWFKVITSNNYNNYAPSLTGGGASGNWGINAQHLLINNATWASDWYWNGQSGQPTWLWGSNDGANMRVWNPANFNVASATKWQTARNIWGQSVDGTGDVNGPMSFGLLAMASNYTDAWSDGTNTHPWYGYDHRYANTGVYSTTISDYFGITLKTGSGNISITSSGNVGIGTTSPSSKLHVVGDILTEGRLKIGNITLVNDGSGSLYIQKADGTTANLLVTGGMSCFNNTI